MTKRNNKQKHMDELHQHILDGAIKFKLTNKDIAALLTGVMRNILLQDHNKAQLESLNIDTNKLTPEAVTIFQRIWTEEYIKELTGSK